MKLEFDNLNELAAFMAWAGYAKVGTLRTCEPGVIVSQEALTGEIHNPQLRAYAELAGGLSMGDGAVVNAAPQGTESTAPAPAARKRRTKAEIEAENAAKAGQTAAQPQLTAQEAIAQALAAAELAKELKAIDPATSQAASAVAGALLETAHIVADVGAKALSPTDPKLLPHEFIQKRAAELGEMQAIEHLDAARNFIAKHGMPKYNESFQLCGLHANVMQFTPAECAMHAAALEWLDKA